MLDKLLFVAGIATLLLLGGLESSPVPSNRELILIDGHNTTIATGSADEIDGSDVALSFADLIFSIVVALNEPDFDYWGNVKEEVELLVGSYINEHNMNQVEAYQGDLESLLLRYLNAPVESENYPDKNQQAAALSISIISHRYLVMSGDLRFSMILHFEDIATMHIIVLKDAAETYSTETAPSQWWMDLNEELLGYLDYSVTVKAELQDWRMGMITCSEQIDTCKKMEGENRSNVRTCYDVYTVIDGVTGETSECRQVQGATDCVNHCQDYLDHRQEELDDFSAAKLTPVTDAWQQLQTVAQGKVDHVSSYYNPMTKDKLEH